MPLIFWRLQPDMTEFPAMTASTAPTPTTHRVTSKYFEETRGGVKFTVTFANGYGLIIQPATQNNYRYEAIVTLNNTPTGDVRTGKAVSEIPAIYTEISQLQPPG
jgi:hypothetical protein